MSEKVRHKYLEVQNINTKEVVKRLNISTQSEKQVGIIMMGMYRNMNTDNYVLNENESDTELPLITE